MGTVTGTRCLFFINIIQGYTFKMNKLILFGAILVTLMVLLPSISAEEKSSKFLTDLCAKCRYCKKDPDCTGCARCSECKNRKQDGCRFCKPGENEGKCIDRCTKGCRVCENLDSCKKFKE